MMYEPVKLDIAPGQHEKLKDAVNLKKAVSIKVNIGGGGKETDHQLFLLTNAQRNRLTRAKLMNKSTITIKLSKKQVKVNAEHRGGFLGTLLGVAAKVLPTLLGGLATGLISGGIEKAVSGRGVGDGLYLHKAGHSVKIIPIRGRGLQLIPKKLRGACGDGLFLKHGSNIYDGRGLLLGKNSPFKNIPILGLIL